LRFQKSYPANLTASSWRFYKWNPYLE